MLNMFLIKHKRKSLLVITFLIDFFTRVVIFSSNSLPEGQEVCFPKKLDVRCRQRIRIPPPTLHDMMAVNECLMCECTVSDECTVCIGPT